MGYFEDLQKLALLSVLRPDYDAWMRRVCRWYSKTFQTPLDRVEALPIDYVLQHYWESVYEELEGPEQSDKLQELLESPDDRKLRLERERIEEDEFVAAVQEEVDKDIVKNKKNIKKAVKGIEKLALKPPPPPDDSIEMRFVDESMLDAMAEAADSKGKKGM
jgi:succinate dehydrogenase flavin-adding protein (antitoxin of CptAB toxin-antitoxin module)